MGSKYGRSYSDLSYAELYNLRSILENMESDQSRSDEIKSFVVIAKDEYNLSYQAISDLLGEYGIVKSRQSIHQIVKSMNSSIEPRVKIEFRGKSLEDMVVHLRSLGYTQMEIADIVKEFEDKSFDYEYRWVRGICSKYTSDIDSIFNKYTEEVVKELRLAVEFRLKDRDVIRKKISYNGHIIKDKEFDLMIGKAYSKLFRADIGDRVRYIRRVFGEAALENIYYTIVKELSYDEVVKLSKEKESDTFRLNLDALNW